MKTISLLVLGVILVGCAPAEKEKLVMRGSNTFGEELAPALIAEFKKDHPGLAYDTEFKATSYGIGTLLAGGCDIAAASRPASPNETVMGLQRNVELADHVIGAYSVAVIVNDKNPASNLTLAQVRDLFTGKVKNWKDVGGPDLTVNLYARDEISGTHLGFRELAMENQSYATTIKTFTSYANIAKAVSQDPGGIGYTAVELPKNTAVKPVSIDGVAPTPATVKSGQYPFHRILRLYTDKAKETTAAKDFIQFILSARGRQILEATGFVPLP